MTSLVGSHDFFFAVAFGADGFGFGVDADFRFDAGFAADGVLLA
ncbi:hypothetical protein [Streptomyces sp. NPDC101237]